MDAFVVLVWGRPAPSVGAIWALKVEGPFLCITLDACRDPQKNFPNIQCK